MFRKRQRKEYPPGTFIPMPSRICAIIHLCLAFIIVAWNMSQPFMGELFILKSQMLLYQDVMGVAKQSDNSKTQLRLARNRERFESLPQEEQQLLLTNTQKLHQLSERSFLTKLGRSMHLLVFEIPSFEQIWLLLSIILPILLLKRVDGAVQAIWLLPLLTLLYAADNQWYSSSTAPTAESKLFPTEEIIVHQYLNHPLSDDIFKQKEQLLEGWKLYLIKEWTTNKVAKREEFENQAEDGEFRFNIARIKSLPLPDKLFSHPPLLRESLWIHFLYLFWNIFFAYIISYSFLRESSQI